MSTFRWTIEAIGSLELRKSALEDDFEEEEEKDEDDQLMAGLEVEDHDKVHYLFTCLVLLIDNIVSTFLAKKLFSPGMLSNLLVLFLTETGTLSWAKPG